MAALALTVLLVLWAVGLVKLVEKARRDQRLDEVSDE